MFRSMNNLAIIIPYYKIQFFRETLLSLEAQTDKRFQLYIGNDASPDDPLPTIKETLTIPYQYYNYAENIGGKNLAEQWERILVNVKEEWFQILGDDDIISENFVSEFNKNYDNIQYFESNVVKTPQIWIDDKDQPTNQSTVFPETFDSTYCWKRKFVEGERASLSENIFRTASYRKYGFQHFPLAWGSDDAAVMDFSENKPIYFLKNTLVSVRISSENISGRYDNNALKKKGYFFYESYILKNHYRKLPKSSLKPMIKSQIDFSYKNNLPLSIPLVKLYLYLRDYRSLFYLPRTYYHLKNK